MSARPDPRQVRRWQEEVARDPGSPAYLPLAEVYRRGGRLDVARRLCLRGLQRDPGVVEAHVLLARVYRDEGDVDRAVDELDIALHLDPEHRAARRALGYLCLERRDWSAAVRHLERAVAREPGDARLAGALALAQRHARAGAGAGTEPAALVGALHAFASASGARLAVLLEPSGRIVAQLGFPAELDLAAFASLGAAIHSASLALARMLGEVRFRQLVQDEAGHPLLLGRLATRSGELLLLAVFEAGATLGLVRLRFEELAREAAGLDWHAPRPTATTFERELAAGLRRAAGQPPTPHP